MSAQLLALYILKLTFFCSCSWTFTLGTFGKMCSRRHIEIIFLFVVFQEVKILAYYVIFSNRDKLHAMSNPVFWWSGRGEGEEGWDEKKCPQFVF